MTSSLERGNGNPLQYSRLENPMDRGAWQDISPWGDKELDMTEQLRTHIHIPMGNRPFLFLYEKLTYFFNFFHSNSFAVDFLKHYTIFLLVIMSLLVCSHLSEIVKLSLLEIWIIHLFSPILRL